MAGSSPFTLMTYIILYLTSTNSVTENIKEIKETLRKTQMASKLIKFQ